MKITVKQAIRRFSHDYDCDTEVIYIRENGKHKITLRYTSEDPDYGTEELTMENDSEYCSMLYMVRYLLRDISDYLDKTNDGLKRPADDKYSDYGNTTLYAFENALRQI